MTSTVHTFESAGDRALRIPTLTADLLPTEVVESRRSRKVRRMVLAGLLLFAVALGGWYAQARHQTAEARGELAAAQQDNAQVISEQARYAELTKSRAQSDAITKQLSTLLAKDLRWSRLVASLQRVAPAGVQLSGVTGALNADDGKGGTGKAPTTSSQLPDTSGGALVGTLTVSGTTPNKAALAQYADTLGQVTGLANPFVADVSAQNGALAFTVRMDITDAALGGRYSKGGN